MKIIGIPLLILAKDTILTYPLEVDIFYLVFSYISEKSVYPICLGIYPHKGIYDYY
jgi:hypothetical protein